VTEDIFKNQEGAVGRRKEPDPTISGCGGVIAKGQKNNRQKINKKKKHGFLDCAQQKQRTSVKSKLTGTGKEESSQKGEGRTKQKRRNNIQRGEQTRDDRGREKQKENKKNAQLNRYLVPGTVRRGKRKTN